MRFIDYGGGAGGGFGGWDGGFGGRGPSAASSSAGADLETQPPMMSFKAFLQTQDDSITDEEALSKYAEYKQEFRRQQLNEFFVAHKEEEWYEPIHYCNQFLISLFFFCSFVNLITCNK